MVLAGRVNVGKSSLINALAGYGRSIVHPTPGTTRDAVTVTTAIDGWPVELCDTAGLRSGGDAVERAGIELRPRAARPGRSGDPRLRPQRGVVGGGPGPAATSGPAALLVHNKCDLPPAPGDRPAGLRTSALRGDGIEDLLAAIARRLVPDPPPPGAAVPFTAEQIEAVDDCRCQKQC